MSRSIFPALLLAMLLALTGCGGSGSSSTPAGGNPSYGNLDLTKNYAQKGPYQPGATVKAWKLGSDGRGEDTPVSGLIGEDGAIELDSALAWDGPTLVEIEGRFFNEIIGNFSADPLRLQGILQADDGKLTGNVNLLTHLLAARVGHVMREESWDYESALNYAIKYGYNDKLGSNLDPAALNVLTRLDDHQLAADSANLLLFSAAFLALEYGQAELDAIADAFEIDFDDTDMDGYAYFRAIGAKAADEGESLLATAKDAIVNNYGYQPPTEHAGTHAWILDACNMSGEWLCIEQGFSETLLIRANASRKFHFKPPHSGTYYIVIEGDIADISAGKYTVREKDSESSVGGCSTTNQGQGCKKSGKLLEGPSGRLKGGKVYSLEYHNSRNNDAGIEISISRLSDGSPDDPYYLRTNYLHQNSEAGKVGGTSQVGTHIAYYWFVAPAAVGDIEVSTSIRVKGFYCSNNPGGELRLYGPHAIGKAPFSDNPIKTMGLENQDPPCPTELVHTLESGKIYYLQVENKQWSTQRFRDLDIIIQEN